MTNGFDLDYDLDIWMLKVKCDLDLSPHTWPWLWILMVKFWNSCISEWEGLLTSHKGCGSRSFMTMTLTIWWPRSGVWIYQIVTGVTSDVGVLLTHLLIYSWLRYLLHAANKSSFELLLAILIHFLENSPVKEQILQFVLSKLSMNRFQGFPNCDGCNVMWVEKLYIIFQVMPGASFTNTVSMRFGHE